MASLPTVESRLRNQSIISSMALEQVVVSNPSYEKETRANQDIAVALDIPVDTVEEVKATNDASLSAAAASLIVNDQAVWSALDEAYQDELTPEEASDVIAELTEKQGRMSFSNFILTQGLMINDGDVNPYVSNAITNLEIWDSLMAEEIDNNEQGLFSKILTFLDVNVLREITIGIAENVTFRSNREGSEIRAAFQDMRPEDFRVWAADYIKERKNEGVFSRDSIWNLYKTAHDREYLGDDPYAPLYAALGLLDAASLGSTGAVRRAAKGFFIDAPYNAAEATKSLSRVRRPADSVAVLRGEADAGAVLAKQTERAGVNTDRVNATRGMPKDLDPVAGPTARPSNVTFREAGRKTVLMEELEAVNKRGTFGEFLTRDGLEQLATETAQRIARSVNDVVVNSRVVVEEGSDDYKLVIRFGQDGRGGAFQRKADAEAIAAKDPRLTVVKREEGRGWFVEAEQRLDVLDVGQRAEILQKSTIIGDFIGKIFDKQTVRLGDRLSAKFTQAEAGRSIISTLVKPLQKKINALSNNEGQRLAKFFEDIRDGDLSHYRQWPDETSFKAIYTLDNGFAPSQKTVDAYNAAIDLSDTAWNIKASARLKKVTAEKGELVELTDGFTEIGFRVTRGEIPENERVLNLVANKSQRLNNITKDAIVYKLAEPALDHIYVTGVPRVRPLQKIDVMPYNVGGPRGNEELRWFVGATNDIKLASGNKFTTTMRTLLGSYGMDQAETAVRELNNIVDRLSFYMKKADVEDISSLALTKSQKKAVDDVIRANNSWNKNITTFEQLVKLADDYKLGFKKQFVFKARDEQVRIEDVGSDISLVGSNYGDLSSVRVNMKRGDTPPMEYGGAKAASINPIRAIGDQFSKEAYGYASRAATHDALTGWVRLAEANPGLVTFDGSIPKADFLNRFLTAKVTKSGKYKDTAAYLREQQSIIKRMLNHPTVLSEKLDIARRAFTEFVFEKSGLKVENVLKGDASGQLLKVGYYSKFGFFNPDQFVLQSLHSSVIIAASPVNGIKALGYLGPVSMLMADMTPDALKLGLKRWGSWAGMDAADLKELDGLIRYMKESGRDIVDTTILELQAPQRTRLNTSLTSKAYGMLTKALDASTILFKGGEKVSRRMGMITAYLDYVKKFPKSDPLSTHGLQWIMNREQDLTFRMTSASKAAWMQGYARVPTQWLSYSFNAMTAITLGRNFTNAEKLRMALVLGPMYGMTGVGLGSMAGYVVEKLGFEPDDPESVKIFNNIKYGIVDMLLGEVFDVDTAYAKRVAPITAPIDLISKIGNEPALNIAFGPSGEILTDFVTAFSTLVVTASEARTPMFFEDLNYLFRNISTYDKFVKINELIDTGRYKSRSHRTTVAELPEGAAAAVAFGATPAAVWNWYDFQDMIYTENDDYKAIEADLLRYSRAAFDMINSGDPEKMNRGAELLNKTVDSVWGSSLSNQLKISLAKRVVQPETLPDVLRQAIRSNLDYMGQLVEQERNR